jgi:hypothetical protein
LIEKHPFNPQALELIDEEDLIGIFAREAIRRMDVEPLTSTARTEIT